MRNPTTAGVLSLVIPGIGQFYNGQILMGLLWLLFTPGFWLGTGGFLGWICHIVSAWAAYQYAKNHPF
jgi:TM2 domain-containing membrane protein YozV